MSCKDSGCGVQDLGPRSKGFMRILLGSYRVRVQE